MKIIAFLLGALLFSCTALSHPYIRVSSHGYVRVVHNVAHQNGRVFTTRRHHALVAVLHPSVLMLPPLISASQKLP